MRLKETIYFFTLCIKGASLAYPESVADWRVRRLRFLFRCLIWWRTTIPWLFVCIRSRHSDVARQFPWIIERIHRPFLHRSLSAWQRLAVSVDHAYLTRSLAPRVVEELTRNGRSPLAVMSSPDGLWYVQLEMLSRFGKEGDWTLTIRDSKGCRLVSCTFSIATIGGRRMRPRMLIGCVQGPDKSVNGRDLYRTLTRQWHGLRPKGLVVYLSQSLASALGLRSVMMVGNDSHVYASWRYRSPKHEISADYRGLCSTLGRTRSWEGWYMLNIPQTRTTAANIIKEVKPQTMRAKRRLLKNSLDIQIWSAINGCLTSQATPARDHGTLF